MDGNEKMLSLGISSPENDALCESHLGARVKCFEECRTAVSSIMPPSLSCLVPLARLNPVPEEVGVITGVERTCAPDIRDMSPRGRSPLVTSAGAPRCNRVIRRSLSAREIGLCAPTGDGAAALIGSRSRPDVAPATPRVVELR